MIKKKKLRPVYKTVYNIFCTREALAILEYYVLCIKYSRFFFPVFFFLYWEFLMVAKGLKAARVNSPFYTYRSSVKRVIIMGFREE